MHSFFLNQNTTRECCTATNDATAATDACSSRHDVPSERGARHNVSTGWNATSLSLCWLWPASNLYANGLCTPGFQRGKFCLSQLWSKISQVFAHIYFIFTSIIFHFNHMVQSLHNNIRSKTKTFIGLLWLCEQKRKKERKIKAQNEVWLVPELAGYFTLWLKGVVKTHVLEIINVYVTLDSHSTKERDIPC